MHWSLHEVEATLQAVSQAVPTATRLLIGKVCHTAEREALFG